MARLADLYSEKPGSKRSNLFPEYNFRNTEEVDVIFPKRKHRDGNEFRDWLNNGYSDLVEDTYLEVTGSISSSSATGESTQQFEVKFPTRKLRDGNEFRDWLNDGYIDLVEDTYLDVTGPISSNATGDATQRTMRNEKSNKRLYPPPLGSLSRHGSLRSPHYMPRFQLQPIRSEGRLILQEVKVPKPVVSQPLCEEGRLVLELIGQDSRCHDKEAVQPSRGSEGFRQTECLPAADCASRSGAHESNGGEEDPPRWLSPTSRRHPSDTDSGVHSGVVGNVDESRSLEISDSVEEVDRLLHSRPLRSLSRQGLLRAPLYIPWIQLCPTLSEAKVTLPVVFQSSCKEGHLVLQLIGQDSHLHDKEAVTNPEVGFRVRFLLSTSAKQEHLVPKGTMITVHKASKDNPLHLRLQLSPVTFVPNLPLPNFRISLQ